MILLLTFLVMGATAADQGKMKLNLIQMAQDLVLQLYKNAKKVHFWVLGSGYFDPTIFHPQAFLEVELGLGLAG